MLDKVKFLRWCPVYINTLNIFRPLKSWWLKRDLVTWKPKLEVSIATETFDEMVDNFYTWYWWDHLTMYNLKDKKLLIIIDDLFYKLTYGLVCVQQVPFILIRIFNKTIIIRFNSPRNKYEWEYVV